MRADVQVARLENELKRRRVRLPCSKSDTALTEFKVIAFIKKTPS
jgi:hypothetical protein